MLQSKSATAIIAMVTVAVSGLAILAGLNSFVLSMGFIPARMTGLIVLPGAFPAVLTPLSSALVHGSWIHLAINMVMLVIAAYRSRVLGLARCAALLWAGAMWGGVLKETHLADVLSAAAACAALAPLGLGLLRGRAETDTRKPSPAAIRWW